MRIGFVSAEYPPAIGGVGDHTQRLARQMTALGHTVQVVTSGGQSPDRRASPGGVHVFPVIRRWDWRIFGTIGRLAHRQAWDVVHIQYQPAAYALHPAITMLPWWLRRSHQPPVVVTTFHDLRVPYMFPKAGPLRRLAVRSLARYSHGVIAVADEEQSSLASWTVGSGHAAAVEFVPLGNHFDLPPPPAFDRQAWRNEIDAAPGSFLLGHLGLVNRSKGVRELIQAAGALRAARRDVRVLMIGEPLGASDPTNATYLAEVRGEIAALGLNAEVRWTGYQSPERVAGWLRCLDLAVLPFLDGPTLRRTSLIGAWAHSVPVLTTEPRHAVEWLRDRPAAATVPDARPDVLARTIADLADSPSRRAALAAAGGAYAARFTWPTVAARTLALYRAARQVRDR